MIKPLLAKVIDPAIQRWLAHFYKKTTFENDSVKGNKEMNMTKSQKFFRRDPSGFFR
jgi:hypothetical protein